MGHLSNKEYFTTTTLIFKLKDVFQENVKNKVTGFQHNEICNQNIIRTQLFEGRLALT